MENSIKAVIEIPFSNLSIARVVYNVLVVDAEPKRSQVTKTLKLRETDNVLEVEFEAKLAKQLRVAVTSFFESLNLITETINFTGPPVSPTYSYP